MEKAREITPTPGPGTTVGAAFDTNRPPHVRIRATTSSGKEISLILDTGSAVNLISENSCKAWGIKLENLKPGEGHLFDIQGQLIPVVGKAEMNINIESRGINTSVTVIVISVSSLKHLIIGWKSLQAWGIFQLQQQVGSDKSPAVTTSTVESYKSEPDANKKCQDVCVDGEVGNQGSGGKQDSIQKEGTQGKNVSLAYNDTIHPSDLQGIFQFIDRAVMPRAVQQPSYKKGYIFYAPHSRDHIERLKAYISSLASQEAHNIYQHPVKRHMEMSIR